MKPLHEKCIILALIMSTVLTLYTVEKDIKLASIAQQTSLSEDRYELFKEVQRLGVICHQLAETWNKKRQPLSDVQYKQVQIGIPIEEDFLELEPQAIDVSPRGERTETGLLLVITNIPEYLCTPWGEARFWKPGAIGTQTRIHRFCLDFFKAYVQASFREATHQKTRNNFSLIEPSSTDCNKITAKGLKKSDLRSLIGTQQLIISARGETLYDLQKLEGRGLPQATCTSTKRESARSRKAMKDEWDIFMQRYKTEQAKVTTQHSPALSASHS